MAAKAVALAVAVVLARVTLDFMAVEPVARLAGLVAAAE
jgi:hypothetical protein